MAARDAAVAAGLPAKLAYTAKETAKYSGIPYRTILDEVAAGRLRAKTYNGSLRGFLIQPEWLDEWMERG